VRTATFILVGLQAAVVAAVIVMAATTRSDAAGEGMAIAYAVIATALLVVFALPALIVALATRQQWLALTLSMLGACVFVALMAML
jgi:hypothetical protein